MNTVRKIARIIVGMVFIFSGFVKLIDPLGSAYKFSDYFAAFGMSFLQPLAFPFAVMMCIAEFAMGACLFMGIKMKLTSTLVLIFMSFFTPLTLILALFNPVTDCGCFGDAIKLTNWQTFYKNLVLLALIIFIFSNRKKYPPFSTNVVEFSMIILFCLMGLGLMTYSYFHLPLVDFRPYHTGVNIPQKMTIPAGMPRDEYKTLLYYSKNGKIVEFTEDNYPWQDTTWKWVDTRSVLVKEGYKPPIHDFNIVSLQGNDITDLVLNSQGYNFLLIAHDLNKANVAALKKANELALFCTQNQIGFYCLTSTGKKDIQNIRQHYQLDYDFYIADETTLKTIVRSNPGLLLLKEGTIIGKWHFKDFPDPKFLNKNFMSSQIEEFTRRNEQLTAVCLGLGFLLLMSIIALVLKKKKIMI